MSIIRKGKFAPLLLFFMITCGGSARAGLTADELEDSSDEQGYEQLADHSSRYGNTARGRIQGPASRSSRYEIDNTAKGAYYLSETEREVIVEINLMRADPARYAQKYLVPLRPYFQGNLLKYPGRVPIATNEGIQALEECIRELEHARPISRLSPCKGLSLAARDHVQDQARTGATGHIGSDGSSMDARLNRYGRWDVSAAENISYGFNDARKIVTALLIDDGVQSRGHRKNLLNGSYRFVGVDIGPHRVYREMCVMDFAGEYSSN